MDPDFWHQRWADNEIGFHQDDINPHLKRHWAQVVPRSSGQVFVPLCGKSRDMLWLRERGHAVLGVELSPKALEDFLAEHALAAEPLTHPQHEGWRAQDLTLFCADLFQLSREDCAAVTAVFDRASLIALPPSMREAYAALLTALLPPRAPILLVTIAYDQSAFDGPPFSVTAEEVRRLFAAFSVEQLHREAIVFRDTPVQELVFRLSR